jgi:hypothetical protein
VGSEEQASSLQTEATLLGVGATVEFGLEIFAERFGHYTGRREIAEIGYVDLGEIAEDGGKRCAGSSNQGEADAVHAGPTAMLRDGVRYARGEIFARERLKDLRFGEIGIVENDRENLRMAFGEKRASDSAGTTTGKRDFLTERKLREARE